MAERKASEEAVEAAIDVALTASVEEIALRMDELAARRVRAAVERACGAVCPECALGKKARAKVLFGYPAVPMHLSDGYPPRECKAAAIRAAFKEERSC